MKKSISRLFAKIKRESIHRLNRRRIAHISKHIPDNDPENPEQAPILIFNASTRLEEISLNAGFSLVTAWALRQAGYPVVHFVCARGMSRCVLGTDRHDPIVAPPCTRCIRTSRDIHQNCSVRAFEFEMNKELKLQLDDLSLAELLQFQQDDLPYGELILPSLRWVLRRHHLQDDEDTRQLARHYILSAENIRREFDHLLDQAEPQAVIVFNGMFYPEAMARFLSQKREIPVYTHEVGMLPDSVFFTAGEATAYPIDIPSTFALNDSQQQQLDEYISLRMTGKFSTAGVEFWPEMHGLDEALQQEIRSYRAVVPVFTNVVFDTSQAHANVVFPHMFAWLDAVLKAIQTHPDTLFIIRAHPDELRPGKESEETVAQWIGENDVLALPNVRFINAREYVSSYELIKAARFVMVYNSTIGLEASILGKPVLCAGKARYTQLPTVFFPPNQKEFCAKLDDFLEQDVIEVPPLFVENARKVLYHQLFLASLPFEAFLQDENHWKGYVKMRSFDPEQLKAEHSPSIKTILRGIQEKEQFLQES